MRMLTAGLVACTLGAAVLAAGPAQAQRRPLTQDDYRQRFEAKLAESWWMNAPWLQDYDAAIAAARASGKLLFVYFTRSYAP